VTTFLLVRHAEHSLGPSVLAGRMPGVALTEIGHHQAERLARRLARERITALHCSPQQRTRETASAIADACGIAIQIAPALDELDFGAWTGKSFAALDEDPRWRLWNSERDRARTAGGETIADLAARVIGHIEEASRSDPAGRIAIISHAEVIRTAVLHYLGLPFRDYARISVDTASISRLMLADEGPRLLSLNEKVGT
jgi:broad specificity phosphatase PhoE